MPTQMLKFWVTNHFSSIKNDNIQVAVDADRKNGIEQLLSRLKPEVILLDDASSTEK
jgi:tetraacyldisaccharide-1-P 4'-kinase